MINVYTGTPGSGKSLHIASAIYRSLNKGDKNIIANFAINESMVKYPEKFTFINNEDLTVNFLINFAKNNHLLNKENQTSLFVDEASVLWNSRTFNNKDRLEWLKFFSQHRKLGFKVFLIVQNVNMIDKQIRMNIENEVVHRKINNYSIGSLIPFPVFIAIEKWFINGEKVGTEFFTYRKKYGEFYDSYKMFDNSLIAPGVVAENRQSSLDNQKENIFDKIRRFFKNEKKVNNRSIDNNVV